MTKPILYCVSVLFACGLLLTFGTPDAEAVKPFQEQFYAKYLKPDSKEAKDQAYAKLVLEAKCFLCHKPEASKKERNIYGTALSTILDKKEDAKNAEKIEKALDYVAKWHSDPDDKKSPSFADLMKAGKLPGGQPKTEGEDEEKAAEK